MADTFEDLQALGRLGVLCPHAEGVASECPSLDTSSFAEASQAEGGSGAGAFGLCGSGYLRLVP